MKDQELDIDIWSLELIYDIEEERNSLLYGKPQKEQTKKVLEKFQEFKEKIMELLKNERFEL